MRVANKKRGAVIELVLFVMTVIFLLSALLVSMSVIAFKHKERTLETLTERAFIDQLAESYIADNTVTVDTLDGTEYTVGTENGQIVVKRGEKVVLTVTLDGGKITSWDY